MAKLPDFIEEYFNEVHDSKIAKDLLNLSKELNEKKERIHQRSDVQNTNAYLHKTISGKQAIVNTGQELRDLDDEYKIKVRDTAKPGIEDLQKFEELAEKHRPSPEYEQRMDRSDKNITTSQEIVIGQKEDFKERDTQKEQEKNALAEKEIRRQKFLEDFKKTKGDITKGIDLDR